MMASITKKTISMKNMKNYFLHNYDYYYNVKEYTTKEKCQKICICSDNYCYNKQVKLVLFYKCYINNK